MDIPIINPETSKVPETVIVPYLLNIVQNEETSIEISPPIEKQLNVWNNIPRPVCQQYLFMYKIQDGHIFKGLIEYVEKFEGSGIYTFSQKKIEYHQPYNNGTKILNHFEINTNDLLCDEFYMRNEINLSFSSGTLKNLIKTVTKGTIISIYQIFGDEKFYFQFNGKEDSMSSIIPIKVTESKSMAPPNIASLEDNPNYKITISDFCSTYTSLQKYKKCNISIFSKGMVLSGKEVTKDINKFNPFGEIDGTFFFTTDLPNTLVKAFSKIKSISPQGIVKIISPETVDKNQQNYAAFIIKIGDYGKLRIFIV